MVTDRRTKCHIHMQLTTQHLANLRTAHTPIHITSRRWLLVAPDHPRRDPRGDDAEMAEDRGPLVA